MNTLHISISNQWRKKGIAQQYFRFSGCMTSVEQKNNNIHTGAGDSMRAGQCRKQRVDHFAPGHIAPRVQTQNNKSPTVTRQLIPHQYVMTPLTAVEEKHIHTLRIIFLKFESLSLMPFRDVKTCYKQAQSTLLCVNMQEIVPRSP